MNKQQRIFIEICKMSQKDVKGFCAEYLKEKYGAVVDENGFLYVKGTDPVLLTAHMDTVHTKRVKKYTIKKGIIHSPEGIGGDDRCGIYMILNILSHTDFRPSVLLCEDEEIGGVGSDKFVRTKWIEDIKDNKFIIELDRAHADDLVFYEDQNTDFMTWCEEITGYKTNVGSFSDISNICPECGISGVNISCGYYYAHTLDEIVVWNEMMNSIEVTKKLIEEARSEKVVQFQYERGYRGRWYDYSYDWYDGWEIDFYDKDEWFHQ